MTPALRALLPLVSLPLVAGLLGVCGEARAQSQTAPDQTAKTESSAGPKKPVRKPDQVLTNDSVALLAVRRAPAAAEKTGTTQPAGTNLDASGTSDTAEKKAEELASLEKQIQDKQKRIVLLMRLFVNDEEPFLRDPANPKGDAGSQDQRKYEQEELLYETSQLAKLKARLNALTAGR